MLGCASLNGWTISPVSRWKRLISPDGVSHFPKSNCSLSQAAASAVWSCAGGTLERASSVAAGLSAPPPRRPPPARRRSSFAQKIATDVGTDFTLQRRSQLRSVSIGFARGVFSGSLAADHGQLLVL